MRQAILFLVLALVCCCGSHAVVNLEVNKTTGSPGGPVIFDNLTAAVDAALVAVDDPDGAGGPSPNADTAIITITDSETYTDPWAFSQAARSTFLGDFTEFLEGMPITLTSNAATPQTRPVVRTVPHPMWGPLGFADDTGHGPYLGANGATVSNIIYEWNRDATGGGGGPGVGIPLPIGSSTNLTFNDVIFRVTDTMVTGVTAGDHWTTAFGGLSLLFGFQENPVTLNFNNCVMDDSENPDTGEWIQYFADATDSPAYTFNHNGCLFNDFGDNLYLGQNSNMVFLNFADCVIRDCSEGGPCSLDNTTTVVDRCIFERCGTGPPPGSQSGAVSLADRGTVDFDRIMTVRNSLFVDCGDPNNNDPDAGLAACGFGTNESDPLTAQSIGTVIHCTFDRCSSALLIDNEGPGTFRFVNNIVRDTTAGAVYVRGHTTNAVDLTVSNNVLENANTAAVGTGAAVDTGAALVNLIESNNPTAAPGFLAGQDTVDTTSVATAFAGGPYDLDPTSGGDAIGLADPFVNASEGGSQDLDGGPRMNIGGDQPDSGAQEVTSSPPSNVERWKLFE